MIIFKCDDCTHKDVCVYRDIVMATVISESRGSFESSSGRFEPRVTIDCEFFKDKSINPFINYPPELNSTPLRPPYKIICWNNQLTSDVIKNENHSK